MDKLTTKQIEALKIVSATILGEKEENISLDFDFEVETVTVCDNMENKYIINCSCDSAAAIIIDVVKQLKVYL